MLDIKPMLAVQDALRSLKRQDIRIHYVKSTDSIGFVKGDKRVFIPADAVIHVSEMGSGKTLMLIEQFIKASQL